MKIPAIFYSFTVKIYVKMRSPKNFPMLETCITPIAVLCLELADHRLISDKTIIYIVSM